MCPHPDLLQVCHLFSSSSSSSSSSLSLDVLPPAGLSTVQDLNEGAGDIDTQSLRGWGGGRREEGRERECNEGTERERD